MWRGVDRGSLFHDERGVVRVLAAVVDLERNAGISASEVEEARGRHEEAMEFVGEDGGEKISVVDGVAIGTKFGEKRPTSAEISGLEFQCGSVRDSDPVFVGLWLGI